MSDTYMNYGNDDEARFHAALGGLKTSFGEDYGAFGITLLADSLSALMSASARMAETGDKELAWMGFVSTYILGEAMNDAGIPLDERQAGFIAEAGKIVNAARGGDDPIPS